VIFVLGRRFSLGLSIPGLSIPGWLCDWTAAHEPAVLNSSSATLL
jgi:hypothetical protein